jgi:hypothetical protein
MSKQSLLTELEKIKSYYAGKGDYTSASQIALAMDVVNDYPVDEHIKNKP